MKRRQRSRPRWAPRLSNKDRSTSCAQNWTPPAGLGGGATLQAVAYFQIERDGSVRGLRLETPSGLEYFDRSFPLSPETARELPASGLEEWSRGPEGRERLRSLVQRQHYRLTFWRRAARERR